MHLNEFQQECAKTDIFLEQSLKFVETHSPAQTAQLIATLLAYIQLVEEVGEVGRHLNRFIRDDKPLDRDAFSKELFDVAWPTNALASHLSMDMEAIADAGLAKLRKRYAQNMIQGEGDNREDSR